MKRAIHSRTENPGEKLYSLECDFAVRLILLTAVFLVTLLSINTTKYGQQDPVA